MTTRTPADLWFDPSCPFAWATSRWLIEVEQVRPIEPRWHLMSLKLLNQDKDVPQEYKERTVRAMGLVRVIAAAQQKYGDQVTGPLYTEFGTRLHNEGRSKRPELYREIAEESLVAVGLDAELVSAMESEDHDDAIAASHEEGIGLVGEDVGTPIIRVGSNAFFGPVITRVPRGEEAGRLWDGVLLVTAFEDFFELKRTRTRSPRFD
ncbi:MULTISPECIES: disulfide bond formation protein DsbA [unclassified Nonomuraea]|uniref:mycothiol-dependent nitroreductase Rv2466c family protein n=1 Tax=unclassified Nonomuraea TaxID=2593643 RepID=UPI0033E57DDE